MFGSNPPLEEEAKSAEKPAQQFKRLSLLPNNARLSKIVYEPSVSSVSPKSMISRFSRIKQANNPEEEDPKIQKGDTFREVRPS